jgi:hypothetical protein
VADGVNEYATGESPEKEPGLTEPFTCPETPVRLSKLSKPVTVTGAGPTASIVPAIVVTTD